MVSFKTNPYPHNAIKTICCESKCKSRAELAKLAWAIMPRCSFCLFKEEKMGLVCQSSASIRHPRFLLFPLFEKGLSKKGEDRSGVSDFILKGAALYAERFVHHYKNTVQFYRECERVMVCG